jgi:hypothetical protein
VVSTKPGLKRFLRVTPGGLLRIDKKKIAEEENLDGKYLLRSSDPELNSEDIALGYKQLLEVETGWPDCCHSCAGVSSSGSPSSMSLMLVA